MFYNLSGLNRLAEQYPATGEPTAQQYHLQTVMVGPVIYQRCCTVSVDAGGLYLAVRPLALRNARLYIPWSAISSARRSWLQWQWGVQLSVGQPKSATLTFKGRLSELVRSSLPATLAPGLS